MSSQHRVPLPALCPSCSCVFLIPVVASCHNGVMMARTEQFAKEKEPEEPEELPHWNDDETEPPTVYEEPLLAPAAATPLRPWARRKFLRSAKAKGMSSSSTWRAPDSGCDQMKEELTKEEPPPSPPLAPAAADPYMNEEQNDEEESPTTMTTTTMTKIEKRIREPVDEDVLHLYDDLL